MNYSELSKIFPNVSRETFDNLEQYVCFLINTNNELNLIGKSTISEIWERHIVDSIQLLSFLDIENDNVIDVGTGAGIPGIILSICGIKKVYLVESKTKKTNFLEKAKKFSTNEIEIINDRIEKLKPIADLVFTCRAFAPLSKIFNLCEKQLIMSKKIIIPKGEKYMDEILVAKKQWHFNFSEHKTITSEKSRILTISNIKKCKK
jgi:16S rRNA (guanine527-N7)-methyltransferase